jgi:hypothetical protein
MNDVARRWSIGFALGAFWRPPIAWQNALATRSLQSGHWRAAAQELDIDRTAREGSLGLRSANSCIAKCAT